MASIVRAQRVSRVQLAGRIQDRVRLIRAHLTPSARTLVTTLSASAQPDYQAKRVTKDTTAHANLAKTAEHV